MIHSPQDAIILNYIYITVVVTIYAIKSHFLKNNQNIFIKNTQFIKITKESDR